METSGGWSSGPTHFGGHLAPSPIWVGLMSTQMGKFFGGPGFCASIFSYMRRFHQGSFAIFLGVCFAFETKLAVVAHAIEHTWSISWRRLWLERDSAFLVDLLRSRSLGSLRDDVLFERGVCVILLRLTSPLLTYTERVISLQIVWCSAL